MRGLLVSCEEEPEVTSRRDWNLPNVIAARLKAHQVARVFLPAPLGLRTALFIDTDQHLYDRPVNRAVTALLEDSAKGRIFLGPALFVGRDPDVNTYCDLSIVAMWRLAAQLVLAQRRQLTG